MSGRKPVTETTMGKKPAAKKNWDVIAVIRDYIEERMTRPVNASVRLRKVLQGVRAP